ncbi:hypothetical protein R1sor_000338 [Riccia sorocarpa]|uniref:Uncharacterized protein n=1 Tax=Riccia sorocarpa TaxID=122646 RepID=A0ABD3GX02_9MARC
MVRDPGRAPSGLHPSQGGQPDRRERDRTHSSSASDLRTTPSTAGGGRPPPHPRKSSGSGAGASGSMSSGGRTPGVTTGAASRGSTPQTSIPVTTSAPTPSIPAAPATIVRGSIERGSRGGPSGEGPSGEGPSGPTIPPIDISDIFEEGADTTTLTTGQMQDLIGRIFDVKLQQFASEMGLGLDIATRLAAKYGPVSVRQKNAKARVESRREKNKMVTNPYGHQGFGGFRARFMKKFGIYPEPKHNAFLRLHGMKRVFEFMRTRRDFPEVGGPSNAEVGADDTAGEDDTSGADDRADGAAAGSDVGADDDGAERSELEGSGDEFEEDDQGQAPQQERVEELEDAEDDEVYFSLILVLRF